ncbi:acrosomal protein SP-10 isoform X1 [Myotis myotis]|uniref:Acrosomal vesicle protein 1 n=1 Tax=Myotis myotis TaxID=51298 RepID=A0A7J7S0T2_MYOMY|nr:acrosomal protein SP-10 isoform X1 [Myotis myotis]KAF6281968.1 acrosomal vesicle protein 1 [Myotis myotis]
MKFLLLMSLYLLGSARGAPSQLDEPPGSLNHQASVQQFSGEPFSLATPSDREAFFDTSSGRVAFSKQAAFEHALVGRASGEHSSGKHPSGEPGVGEHAAGEHAAGEHAPGEPPPGVQAEGEPPPGEQAPAEHAPAEHAPAEHAPAEHAPAEHAAAEHAAAEHAAAEQAVTELTAKEQPSGEQPSGEQASGEQPSGSPAATSAGPAINCHTCSYMNSEAKCLRGEGSCTIQNSQQCMLKKIFEGGKLEFMVQGCENMCPSMSLFSHGTRMQLICCRDASFCNKT